VKLAGLLLVSLAAWYLGCLFAVLVSKETITIPIANLEDIVKKPVLKAPVPKRQKCDHWSPCSPGNYAYRILSGGGTGRLAKICFEDDLPVLGCYFTTDRFLPPFPLISMINLPFRIVECCVIDSTDHSEEMGTFIKNAPEGSLLLMVTHDDGSTRLKDNTKKLVEELGSKEIRNMKFRSSWAFIAAKGFKLPDDIQKEKINHSDKNNRYRGWPAEIQIEGCIPRNLI
ncbi:FAM3B protein, partial [Rhinoptilus africanus]|nr:FAM3B protein [Rhinoptilus africanus]